MRSSVGCRLGGLCGYFATAVIVLGVFTAACSSDENPETAAPADTDISVSFDGGRCSWEGPALVEQGTFDISLSNAAEVDLFFAGFLMQEPALSLELYRMPVGADMDVVTQRTAFPEGEMAFGWWSSPGELVQRAQLLTAGVYLFDCLTGTPFDHVWRVAEIEIVAP